MLQESTEIELEYAVPDYDSNTEESKVELLPWLQLSSLETHPELRTAFEELIGVTTEEDGTKSGIVYTDENGDRNQNNTLFNALGNTSFTINCIRDAEQIEKLEEIANNEYTDIEENQSIPAVINAYFELLPDQEEGQFDGDATISRAQAMTLVMRATTQVNEVQAPEEDADFTKAVGESMYNTYAFGVADESYLDYKNGSLCYDTYNSAITRAEVLYMIVQRYWADEYNNSTSVNGDFTDCTNAGDVATELGLRDKYAWQAYELDYCLQTGCGCPEDLYKALVVAKNHGLIGSETKWDQSLMGGTLLGYMISAYTSVYNTQGFSVNAKLGENVGESLIEVAEETPEEPEVTEETIGSVVVSQVRDVTNLDDLLKIYGDEIEMTDEEIADAYEVADQWTFEAADQWMEVAHCGWLNVRTGPSTDYSILSSVPSGTKCHIVAVCKENGWYRIIANKKIVYQCGVYFQDFEGSEDYLMRTGENANDY